MTGPAIGRILAALARDDMPNLPIGAFARVRFAGSQAGVEPVTLHG